MGLAVRRKIAGHRQAASDISERRACQATGFGRSSERYRKRADPPVALRMRIKMQEPRRMGEVRFRRAYIRAVVDCV